MISFVSFVVLTGEKFGDAVLMLSKVGECAQVFEGYNRLSPSQMEPDQQIFDFVVNDLNTGIASELDIVHLKRI